MSRLFQEQIYERIEYGPYKEVENLFIVAKPKGAQEAAITIILK